MSRALLGAGLGALGLAFGTAAWLHRTAVARSAPSLTVLATGDGWGEVEPCG